MGRGRALGDRVARLAFTCTFTCTFEVLTDAVQGMFQGDEITEISATLDKVTIQHRTFTVLVCFFYYKGSIYSTAS